MEELHRKGIFGFKCHLQGSYGILNYSELCFDYARAGIALYGILSGKGDKVDAPLQLHPVLSLKARVETVKTLYRVCRRHPQEPVKLRVCALPWQEGAGHRADLHGSDAGRPHGCAAGKGGG